MTACIEESLHGRRGRVVIIKRTGLPFFLHRYRNRKMFFAGAVFCISLLYLFSRFIWGIDISGNKSYTDEILLKYLSSREIKSGMKKSQVDCGRIVKDLRREYGDIIWVSASSQFSSYSKVVIPVMSASA